VTKPTHHDLDNLTVPELTAFIEAAQAKRQEKIAEAKSALRREFEEKAAQLGLTLDAVLRGPHASPARKAIKGGSSSVPVKYRGPNGEEWSGRGRTPKWLQEAEASGKARDTFKV